MTWRNKIGLGIGVFWMGLLFGSALGIAFYQKFSFWMTLGFSIEVLTTVALPFLAGMLYMKPRDPKYDGKEKEEK